MLNRLDILYKTNWGSLIYCAILHDLFPGQTVMHQVGWDCGLCPNPYDNGQPTLHVWMENLEPEKKLANHEARHHDESGHIPDGNCFDFAALHYGLEGQALLERINKDLYLHLEEDYNPYGPNRNAKPEPEKVEVKETTTEVEATQPQQTREQPENEPRITIPTFSFFRAPISNTIPCRSANLLDIHKYVTSEYAKARTLQLRSITDKTAARQFKAHNFDYATFSGRFANRQDKQLLEPSHYLCVDFDHVPDVEELVSQLLQDEYFDTELLFRSPSGDGVKWIIPVTSVEHTHAKYFCSVANYIKETYGLEVDQSGKDISRACFLPYDPSAYLNPKYLK